MENSKQKKLQSVILNSILTIFNKEKMEKFYVDCNDILTIGIDIIRFDINIIRELIFTIILYLFLLHIHLEGEYLSFSLIIFFINSQLSLLP